jgi:uncharacterized protein YcbX
LRLVGEISEINRYPVKSFAGESLQASIIEPYGLYGDRIHAFIDGKGKGWDSFITARTIPDMLAYKAELIGEGAANEFPKVYITSPDGQVFNWDEALLEDIQKCTSTPMSMMSYTTQTPELMAVDTGSILIISDATLRHLEKIWGKPLDKRRFRANLIVSLYDNAFDESMWIGKRLLLGGAELQVDIHCKRCSMITMDPDTLERDSSLLKKVNEEMNLNFGVYASVKRTGSIRVGEKVYVVN